MNVCVHGYGVQKVMPVVFLGCSVPDSLRQSLLLSLELTIWDRMLGQQLQEFWLCLPPSPGLSMHATVSDCCTRALSSGPHACTAGTFQTMSSPGSSTHFYLCTGVILRWDFENYHSTPFQYHLPFSPVLSETGPPALNASNIWIHSAGEICKTLYYPDLEDL